jgi:transcriptional regulator with XRE-family HTH domain
MDMLRDKQRLGFLAANLRAAMAEKSWSQEQLETESGVSQCVISRTLNARGEPGAITLFRLARALGKTMDEMLAVPRRQKISA